MSDPHQNIFYYYRGPSSKKIKPDSARDIQVEDNATKSLINILEFFHRMEIDTLSRDLLNEIGVRNNKKICSFGLQRSKETSRPDGIISFPDGCEINIECKVAAKLEISQIRNHLKSLRPEDGLLVITDCKDDLEKITKEIKDTRVKYLSWSEIHKICLSVSKKLNSDKKIKHNKGAKEFLQQFIDYLEIAVMKEFHGFRNEDFDLWVKFDRDYARRVKEKLETLAELVKKDLPKVYSYVRLGDIRQDKGAVWVAIKKPNNKKDIFNQCNFTIEISKSDLQINTVIRNGKYTDRKPVGIFYRKLENPREFRDIIKGLDKKIRENSWVVIGKRVPISGRRIRQGNEKWLPFYKIQLNEITKNKDVEYLRIVLTKVKYPGIHIRYSIDRGKPILEEPKDLIKQIVKVITAFRPFLAYLEEGKISPKAPNRRKK